MWNTRRIRSRDSDYEHDRQMSISDRTRSYLVHLLCRVAVHHFWRQHPHTKWKANDHDLSVGGYARLLALRLTVQGQESTERNVATGCLVWQSVFDFLVRFRPGFDELIRSPFFSDVKDRSPKGELPLIGVLFGADGYEGHMY